MNKVLIIPDVHGRDFWKTPCENWDDRIVFLGDYHDPYGNWVVHEPNMEQSRKNLRELVDFVTARRNNPDKDSTICLLGNHDCHYYTRNLGCRSDDTHFEEIRELLDTLNPQISYELIYNSTEVTNKFLFTHAGVTKDWADWHNLSMDGINKISVKDSKILEEVPYSRGGYSKYGSCLWNSLDDYDREEHISEYYQIFGHTWGGRTKPVIKKDYAMLDCGKAFVLDLETKNIREWNT